MRPGRSAIVVGVGLSAFLVVGALVTELASSAIEFSVFVGIPAGLLAAAVALLVTNRLLESPSRLTYALLAGVATIGFAVIAGFAIRYAVAATRSLLSLTTIGVVSLLLAVAVAVATWIRPPEAALPSGRR